jgi:hypothetical protein
MRLYQGFRRVDGVEVAVRDVGDDEGCVQLSLGRGNVGDVLGLAAALRLALDLGDRLVHRPQRLVGGIVLKSTAAKTISITTLSITTFSITVKNATFRITIVNVEGWVVGPTRRLDTQHNDTNYNDVEDNNND